jgi:hypothetical protein
MENDALSFTTSTIIRFSRRAKHDDNVPHNVPIESASLSYQFQNELFYEFLSFAELEEPNDLKHYVDCIQREKMQSAIPHNMGHSS